MTIDTGPPVGVESLDIDPFDRMVLTTDGTVTTLLAARTAEPLATRTMRQAGPATLEAIRGRSRVDMRSVASLGCALVCYVARHVTWR